jgi:hypothetical protein
MSGEGFAYFRWVHLLRIRDGWESRLDFHGWNNCGYCRDLWRYQNHT